MKFFIHFLVGICLFNYSPVFAQQTAGQQNCGSATIYIPARYLLVVHLKNKTYLLDHKGEAYVPIEPESIDSVQVLKYSFAKTIQGFRGVNSTMIVYIKKHKAREEYRHLKPYLR